MEAETIKEMTLEIDKEMNPWAYNLDVNDEYTYLNTLLALGHLVKENIQINSNNGLQWILSDSNGFHWILMNCNGF